MLIRNIPILIEFPDQHIGLRCLQIIDHDVQPLYSGNALHRPESRGNAMLSIDWRLPAAYDHTKIIPAAGFAWDYLRRDEDYHRDFARIRRIRRPAARSLAIFSQRWGLRFPTRPKRPAGS
ncbi:transcriptional regulator domain-containing protein [Mesorhizobium sp. PUT5]|uniref:transcriptional regulator domain-containing protein n=1 Tax=Mesorhizobium sp. PUT5 TaxID=3454629 RepID=UPI003FA41D3E